MASVNRHQLAAVEPHIRWLCGRLKQLREERGYTLAWVGAKMETSHSRVSDTESNRYDVKLSTVLRMMLAIGADWSDLVKDAPDLRSAVQAPSEPGTPPPSPITLIWNPPESDGLADIVNSVDPELPPCNVPPQSPTKPITLLWSPPTSDRLADVINIAHPELPPVNDYEAIANLAIINESLEAYAEENGSELWVVRATPVLVMHLLGIAQEPITPDTVSEMLQKIYSMYGDQPVGFESEDGL